MRQFRFPLQTLLHHRENLEEREKSRLARLRFAWQCEQDHLRELASRLQQLRAELRERQAADFDPEEHAWFYRYQERLKSEARKSEERIATLEEAIEKQTNAAVEASRNRKVLDGLRKRKLRDFWTAVEREEQKNTDEIVTSRFHPREK